MGIVTSYVSSICNKNNDFLTASKETFCTTTQTGKLKAIDFFDSLYSYPPKFKVNWDIVDEVNRQPLTFMSTLNELAPNDQEYKGYEIQYPFRSYLKGYLDKISSTRFYNNKTLDLQNAIKNVPIYMVLNGNGEIILADTLNQVHTNSKATNLYDACGSFDLYAEQNSKLGFL